MPAATPLQRGYGPHFKSFEPTPLKKVQTVLEPQEALWIELHTGYKKWFQLTFFKHIGMAVMGGFWVGLYSHCATTIYQNLVSHGANSGYALIIFGWIFNTALMSIIVTGADLLTSNMFYTSLLTVDMFSRKIFRSDVVVWKKILLWAKYIGTSFLGNYIGCGGIALAISYGTQLDNRDTTCYLSEKKANAEWWVIFLRAIFANVCIVIATHFINSAQSMEGKCLSSITPVIAFCVGGGEHVVANMFLVTAGLTPTPACNITWSALCKNIGMAFLGNYFAAFFVAVLVYFYCLPSGKFGQEYETGGQQHPANLKRLFSRTASEQFTVSEYGGQLPTIHKEPSSSSSYSEDSEPKRRI